MKKIAVLVSGGGTNLQALLDAQQSGILKSGRITRVVSSTPGAYALTRAEQAGVETMVIDRKAFSDRASFSAALLQDMQQNEIDLIVFAGFMYVLTEEFCQAYANRIINVHPSLIPAFCGDGFYGLHVHERVLEYGAKVTGATVHFVNEVTDGGAIILQQAVEVREGDTPSILQKRVMEQAEWMILPKAVELFCADRLEINGRTITIKEG